MPCPSLLAPTSRRRFGRGIIVNSIPCELPRPSVCSSRVWSPVYSIFGSTSSPLQESWPLCSLSGDGHLDYTPASGTNLEIDASHLGTPHIVQPPHPPTLDPATAPSLSFGRTCGEAVGQLLLVRCTLSDFPVAYHAQRSFKRSFNFFVLLDRP